MMEKKEKAVMRLNDGRLLKGFVEKFSEELPELALKDADSGMTHTIITRDVKAVFFVRCFEGDQEYKEKKSYATVRPKGKRVFVKFRDGEGIIGFLDGDVPWEKGFFLSKGNKGKQGFYLWPVDKDSNNIKVFVVASSVDDVTVVPKVISDRAERV